MIGIVLGSAIGFVVLPYVAFMARPTVIGGWVMRGSSSDHPE